MKKWLQQAIFRERVLDYCRERGLLTLRGAVKLDELSDIFDVHEDTLRQFLQNKNRSRPHINTLARIANILRVSVTEFIDAPSDPPLSITHEKWEQLSEHERALASEILADLTETNLSLKEKEELFGAYKDLKARILRLRK